MTDTERIDFLEHWVCCVCEQAEGFDFYFPREDGEMNENAVHFESNDFRDAIDEAAAFIARRRERKAK